jgi:hypothetical protein
MITKSVKGDKMKAIFAAAIISLAASTAGARTHMLLLENDASSPAIVSLQSTKIFSGRYEDNPGPCFPSGDTDCDKKVPVYESGFELKVSVQSPKAARWESDSPGFTTDTTVYKTIRMSLKELNEISPLILKQYAENKNLRRYGRENRTWAANYFRAEVVEKNVTHYVIDYKNSTFCEEKDNGNRVIPGCVENIVKIKVPGLDRFLIVRNP